MSTDFRPAGLTADPEVEAVIPAASLKGATTNWGLVPEHRSRELVDMADMFIDTDTNGEGVDFYALKA